MDVWGAVRVGSKKRWGRRWRGEKPGKLLAGEPPANRSAAIKATLSLPSQVNHPQTSAPTSPVLFALHECNNVITMYSITFDQELCASRLYKYKEIFWNLTGSGQVPWVGQVADLDIFS